jgi:hypothetical protein
MPDGSTVDFGLALVAPVQGAGNGAVAHRLAPKYCRPTAIGPRHRRHKRPGQKFDLVTPLRSTAPADQPSRARRLVSLACSSLRASVSAVRPSASSLETVLR